jgi:hypothetical protein
VPIKKNWNSLDPLCIVRTILWRRYSRAGYTSLVRVFPVSRPEGGEKNLEKSTNDSYRAWKLAFSCVNMKKNGILYSHCRYSSV